MGERIHTLAQHFFGKNALEEISVEEARSLANRYPYMAPAQFLLLEKLQAENDPGYGEQLQKAILYYADPLAFHYFITPERFITEEPGFDFDMNAGYAQEKSIDEERTIPEEKAVEDLPVNQVGQEDTSDTRISNILTAPVQETDLTFEPYHTVDYFASQGIKLSQEEISTDKFGKQLKSFTEWLKTMKRIPAVREPAHLDAGMEEKVQNLAEDSVHEADVVTESMAEVWLKQGNKAKAIEVYHKLSLLNPAKKAFFAAKIENLKNV